MGKAKRPPKAGGRKPKVEKTPVSKKSAATTAPQSVRSTRPVTGKAVAALRAKFGMSQRDFARLLGVSVATVVNWERNTGALSLHTRTLAAWNAAKRLTKRQAIEKLRA
jgi:DNA-binding transcriptional regulator YiaG